MPKVPSYINTQASTPLSQQGPIDAAAISPGIQAAQQTGYDNVNSTLAKAEQAGRQAESNRIALQETQFQNQLKLPGILQSINESRSRALLELAQIDSQQRAEQQKVVDEAFSLSEKSKFDSDLLQFKQQLSQQIPADGAGYTEALKGFIDNRMAQAATAAPSISSKLDMIGYGSKVMKGEVEAGYKLESQYRLDNAKNQVAQKIGVTANMIRNNPDLADQFISEADQLRLLGKSLQLTDNQVESMVTDAISGYRKNQVDGYIQTQQFDKAHAVLTSDAAINEMRPEDYTPIYDKYASANREFLKASNDEAELARNEIAVLNDKIDSSFPGYGKAVDSLFKKVVGDTSNIDPTQVNETAKNITAALLKLNKGLGSQTKEKIINAVSVASNPNEAAAYALGIDGLLNGDHPEAINTFKSLPEDTKTMIMGISGLLKAGNPIQDTIKLTQDAFNASINPRSATFVADLVDTNTKIVNGVDPVAIKVEDVIDSWNVNFPREQLQSQLPEMRVVYTQYIQKYQNKELADSAFESYLKGTWSVTDVNGNNQVMRNAPETIFILPGEMDRFNADWSKARQEITAQLKGTIETSSALSDQFYPEGGGISKAVGKSGFEIKSGDKKYTLSLETLNNSPVDPVTGAASYYVKANNEFIYDEMGRPLQFIFDVNKGKLAQDREARIKALEEDSFLRRRNLQDYLAEQDRLADERKANNVSIWSR